MQDLKELLERHKKLDNYFKFASVVSDIWDIGTLKQIKERVSREAFAFHVVVNLIGGWQSDGWDFIFAEGNELLAYTSEALEELGFLEHKACFDEMVIWLRSYFESVGIDFLNFRKDRDKITHYDVINFLLNPRFKIENQKLNLISKEERARMSKEYRKRLDKLDEISFKIWGCDSADNGFCGVSRYVQKLNC